MRKIKIILFSVFTLGVGLFFLLKSPSDLLICQSLELLFARIESNELTAYRNQDWCQVLEYKGRAFANTQKSTCTFVAKFPTEELNLLENKKLKDISDFLSSAMIPIRSIERIRYSNSKIRYIEFHKDCSCRTRYIYDPGYTLPTDEPNNLWHFSISKDWYRVEEDWN